MILTVRCYRCHSLRPDKPSPRGQRRAIQTGYSQPSSVLAEMTDPTDDHDFHATSVMFVHGGTQWTMRPNREEISSPRAGWAQRDLKWSWTAKSSEVAAKPRSPRYVRAALSRQQAVWKRANPQLASATRRGIRTSRDTVVRWPPTTTHVQQRAVSTF